MKYIICHDNMLELGDRLKEAEQKVKELETIVQMGE